MRFRRHVYLKYLQVHLCVKLLKVHRSCMETSECVFPKSVMAVKDALHGGGLDQYFYPQVLCAKDIGASLFSYKKITTHAFLTSR